jgi:ATP-dependent exoDNAse (exonuclease V) beta subunit
MCFSTFDADKILERMKIKGSKYDGMTKEEIKEVWNHNAKDAQQQGTRMHSVIERYYKQEPITDEEKRLPEILQFMEFVSEHKLAPHGIEWCVYSRTIQLAGTIDFAVANEDGTIDLYDWKRSKHMELQNPYRKYSHVIQTIPDTNYWHYTVQLNLYKYVIEKEYNKKVRDMYLVCFYPTQTKFEKYKVSNIQVHIPIILEQLKLKQSP